MYIMWCRIETIFMGVHNDSGDTDFSIGVL